MPVLAHIERLARLSYRCRVVNRAFGASFDPATVAALLPDEDIDLLAALQDQDQIVDVLAYLKLLLTRP